MAQNTTTGDYNDRQRGAARTRLVVLQAVIGTEVCSRQRSSKIRLQPRNAFSVHRRNAQIRNDPSESSTRRSPRHKMWRRNQSNSEIIGTEKPVAEVSARIQTTKGSRNHTSGSRQCRCSFYFGDHRSPRRPSVSPVQQRPFQPSFFRLSPQPLS
ncbi:hypothetical protein TNCT_100151 [Trichonephila clavata]|uniref:Uncharacterized protein n=1 Tax=Trichonephila clavata TaxID=2740835 RepID=A0A8X6KAY7_TRICU|nr:hypothetical protein TNCT_100151 [Trichonephila clavata]